MTTQEILKAEQAIAGMRDYLCLLVSTKDVEKLIPLVLQSRKPLFGEHFNRLICLLVFIRPYENKEIEALYLSLNKIYMAAVGAKIAPDQAPDRADEFKKLLIDRVAQGVPRAQAALDKIAQWLSPQEPESTAARK